MSSPIRTLSSILLAACIATTAALAHAESPSAGSFRESYRLEAAGDSAGALRALRSLDAKTKGSYFVLARLAWLSYLAGDYDAAVAGYKKAISKEPKAIEPRLGLSMVLAAQGKWRDLERAAREVIKLDPKSQSARGHLALATYSIGNYPDSATMYRKLSADYPANLNYKTGLGWALLKMGRRAAAMKLFNAVLAVSPDNPNALAGAAQR